MKKIYIIILFAFVFFSADAQTNVYHPFPDSNAYWNSYKSWMVNSNPPVGVDVIIWDWIVGDTVIGSFTYKKIKEYTYCQNNAATTLGLAALLRQDSIQKKVFLFNGHGDTLLYDFNLSVGDTIPKWYINTTYPQNKISSIDSILIGTTYRKRFNISMGGCCGPQSLIEGIGSTMGLFLPLDQGVEHGSTLQCFSHNGQTLYPNSTGSCNFDVGINNIIHQNDFSISPNPTSGIFNVQMSKFENVQMEIYNVMGGGSLQQLPIISINSNNHQPF